MHSWRVLLLPYLDQAALYRAYRFDEPWDGSNNRKLGRVFLNVFRCYDQSDGDEESLLTPYVVVVGPDTMFPGAGTRTHKDVRDGIQNTILVVEKIGKRVHWMSPNDTTVDEFIGSMSDAANRDRPHPGIAHIGMADGRVVVIKRNVGATIWESLLTIAGGEQIDERDY